MNIVVLSDTHITRTGSRLLPERVYRALRRADVILHAGDVVVGEVLEDLRRFAPVHAVRGNNDVELTDLPDRISIELDGLRVGMVHDSGPRDGREGRLRRWFPDRDVVVFGHSHIPLVADGIDGQMLLNPGSPTDKRRQTRFTFATLTVEAGRRPQARLVAFDREA